MKRSWIDYLWRCHCSLGGVQEASQTQSNSGRQLKKSCGINTLKSCGINTLYKVMSLGPYMYVYCFKGTTGMSICRPKNEKVKFQLHLKDNTNLELPSKRKDLKMAWRWKISTISCQIDLSDCNDLSNSLTFRPFYWRVVRYVLLEDSVSLILAITSINGLLTL